MAARPQAGGRLLIVDGDFVRRGFAERLLDRLEALIGRKAAASGGPSLSPDLAERHRSILSRVHFKDGARAEAIARMLAEAGFAEIAVDTRLGAIHRAQGRHMPLAKALARQVQHRYAILAVKPER